MLGATLLILGMLLVTAPGDQTTGSSPDKDGAQALVIAVRGEVIRSLTPKGAQALIKPLDVISEGETVRMGKNARIDLLFDHRWLSFVGHGELKSQRNRWSHPGSIRRTRAREMPDELPVDGLNRWSIGPEQEEGSDLTIERPRETAIRDHKPTLRWSSTPTQRTTRLDLLAVIDGRLELVETWRGLRGKELRVHRSLRPETLYFWRIADEGLQSTSEDHAWFIIRGPKRIQALDDWVRSLDGLRSDDDEDRHVAESLLAIGLERTGLLEEARSSWRALASQGRILDVASKRSADLKRRRLTEPRAQLIVPLPFQIRLQLQEIETQGQGP